MMLNLGQCWEGIDTLLGHIWDKNITDTWDNIGTRDWDNCLIELGTALGQLHNTLG